jgi:hypothetical protein
MAPISLATLGEFASQLTQEFGDRDSQIVDLKAEITRLRALEVDNARLRAELDAARASSNSGISSNTATATLGVESQSRGVANENRQQSEKSLLDEACDVTEADGGRSPRFPGVASGRVNSNSRIGNSFRRQNWSSDDDEDPIPVPKKEKAPVSAAAKKAVTQTSILAGANKRKRAAESSSSSARLSESLNGLVVDESNARSQQNEARPAKRARPEYDATAAAAARPKHPRARPVETPVKKCTHPPHAYTPLQKSPFQKATPPPPPPRKQQQPSDFRQPGSETNNNKTSRPSQPKKRKNQPSHTTSQPATNDTTAKRTSTYAEIIPFTFKFIESYLTPPTAGKEPNFEFHDSASLKGTMSSFWKALASLFDTWEDQAGAEWAWEVQKRVKSSASGAGNGAYLKVCVTSKLEPKLTTRWRAGDTGFFACPECTSAARPCFTWVWDEDGGDEDGGDGDEVFGAPKGEFWCLPVHKGDRRCVNVKDREIRTWVNEGESSSDEGSSGSGEESEQSGFGAVDEYDDDDSELTSGASSEESSEEDLGRDDSDGEL